MRATIKLPKLFVLLPLLVLLATSCSEFRKIQRSGDWEKKYEAALEYYKNEEYGKAAILLEEVLPLTKGTSKAEEAQFYYAYALFHQDLFIESGYYFKLFYDTYGRSPLAEEALFMHGYSLYLQSPRYNLDQTSSFEAIQAMQNFINIFAYSEYKERATEILDQLQAKLERKAYENAKLYAETGRFKAALVALENFGNDFPDSDYNEEVDYLKVKVAYELAENSLESLQRERFYDVIDHYQDFVDRYPESTFGREAEKAYVLAQEKITDINQESKQNNS
ncbi:outer membrane protein assembly factor BamD [Nafulsella turpanensis]|uniref:outer membrane protein assembly factor BamD n=1 Tax=Nafulsella turpanensis TaxID=1265690 RepID=UPI00058B13FC|nr:outer membrane protein assembly factor BamD [Nafulsella turpanensis]